MDEMEVSLLHPNAIHAKAGDPVRLGTCIGFGMEPGYRMGRLVGIVHNPQREIERYVMREFAPGDGWYPTGGYRTTALPFLTPHRLAEGEQCTEPVRPIRWK